MREWLKQRRTEQHLTGAELAQKVGISESYYFLIESGKRQNPMTVNVIAGFAKALNIDPAKILDWELQ